KLLLEAERYINAKDGPDRTAIEHAVNNSYENIVVLLLKSGKCTGNAMNNLLHYAASNGHENYVQLLLETECDINTKDETGRTAAEHALDKGYESIAVLLLKSDKCTVDVITGLLHYA